MWIWFIDFSRTYNNYTEINYNEDLEPNYCFENVIL